MTKISIMGRVGCKWRAEEKTVLSCVFLRPKHLSKLKMATEIWTKTVLLPPPPPYPQLKPLQLLETKGKRKELLQREHRERRVVAEGSQRERERRVVAEGSEGEKRVVADGSQREKGVVAEGSERKKRGQRERRVVAEGSEREREELLQRGQREREELLQRGQRSGGWGEMLAGPARHILIRAVLKRDRSMVSHKGK